MWDTDTPNPKQYAKYFSPLLGMTK